MLMTYEKKSETLQLGGAKNQMKLKIQYEQNLRQWRKKIIYVYSKFKSDKTKI